MVFKSLFTKGVALAQSGRCRNHSKRASNHARQAMSKFNGKLEFPDEDKDNKTT